MIELTAADGHIFSAYRADPSDTPKGAVVVLHEVFGIDPHIKKVTESFAAQGYVALAPALFDRVKKNVEFGYDEAGLAAGFRSQESSGRPQTPSPIFRQPSMPSRTLEKSRSSAIVGAAISPISQPTRSTGLPAPSAIMAAGSPMCPRRSGKSQPCSISARKIR